MWSVVGSSGRRWCAQGVTSRCVPRDGVVFRGLGRQQWWGRRSVVGIALLRIALGAVFTRSVLPAVLPAVSGLGRGLLTQWDLLGTRLKPIE